MDVINVMEEKSYLVRQNMVLTSCDRVLNIVELCVGRKN